MATKKHDKPIARTTKGKDANYKPTEKGAGMTAKGRAEYNAKNRSRRPRQRRRPARESRAQKLELR